MINRKTALLLSGPSLYKEIKCQVIRYSRTVQRRDSSGEIRTTDMELGPPTSLLDYFSCIYSMYLELPCIKPSVAICMPKTSKPFAPLSFGKNRGRILTPETLHYTDPNY